MASAVIYALQTVSGNQPQIARVNEEASQTALLGVPCQVAADGGIQEWDGVNVTSAVAGFSKEAFSNLTTTGVAKTLTFGSVPYEASAVNIPRGAPLNDGRIGFEVANNDSVFFAQIGPSQSLTGVVPGQSYGMTKDTDGHWYVDTTKTGAAAVVSVVALDYNDTTRGVHIRVMPAAQQPVA